MADNAGDSGGEWTLIMTDAERKRAKKNDLLLPGRTPATNTSLHGNPSSSGWETRAKKTAIPLSWRPPSTSTGPHANTYGKLQGSSSDCKVEDNTLATIRTMHRELNDLLGAYADLPEYTAEMSSTLQDIANLTNWMLNKILSHKALDALPGSSSIGKDETKGAPISYKKGFIGEKVASVVVCTIDLQLQPKEGSYSIDEHRIMHLNVPSFEVCNPKKPSRVEEPDRVGGPCPGFVLQPLPGRPSVPCPYGILRRNTTNSRWNKAQWLKCHGCTALQNNLSANVIHHDKSENKLKVILSNNISARTKFVSILLTRLLFVL